MTNRKNWPVGLSTSHFGALAGRGAGGFAEYRRAGIRIAELSPSDGQLMAFTNIRAESATRRRPRA